MLDHAAAASLIDASRLFDEEWYAATSGASFASRAEAIEHWLAHASADATPHPLFEPRWLYPGGRWSGQAPDPLSFYLSRRGAGDRGPHPRFDPRELGDPQEWLAGHEPAELLPEPEPRAAVGEVSVVVPADQLRAAVAWARHLHRVSPEVTGVLTGADAVSARILRAVAADLPSIRVEDEVTSPIRVDVAAGIRPPRWPWLPELLAALDRPGVAAAGPLLLAEDFTVAGPVLAGHPIADAERLDGLPVPVSGVVARRVGADGETVLATGSRLVVPEGLPVEELSPELWKVAGFESAGVPIRVREGRPALRWSIDIAAGAGPIGTRWGDYHFARSLGAALDRLGQWVGDRPSRDGRPGAAGTLDDVVLVIRGLVPTVPPAHTTNLMWVISHPDEITLAEVASYDAVFAASRTWAADRSAEWKLPIEPLLQCTDTTRFHPGLAEPDSGPRRLFVGNARHQLRPSVAAAIETGTPLTVIGTGWDEWLPAAEVRVEADRVANEELPALYASAGLVLNDHWEDMRVEGFVSNRIFDVLATGARLLTDEVAGLAEVLGDGLTTWSHLSEFAHLTGEPLEHHYPDEATRLALAERVVAEHSFDARAATLLETALNLRLAR